MIYTLVMALTLFRRRTRRHRNIDNRMPITAKVWGKYCYWTDMLKEVTKTFLKHPHPISN